MKAKLKYQGKTIEITDMKEAKGIKKISGLMFKSKDTSALLFKFSSPTDEPIHSFFCPYFLAIWLDEKNRILEYKLITPNKLSIKPKEKYSKLLEIPLNNKYSSVVKLLIKKEKV